MKRRKFLFPALSIAVMAFFSCLTTQAQTAPGTARIKIDKGFCRSIGQQNTCNGTPDTFPSSVDFSINLVGQNNGPIVPVPIKQNANGTLTVDGFDPNGTYLICEIVPLGFVSLPRPDSSTGGGSQSAVGSCIQTQLGNGVTVTQFLNGPAQATAASVTVRGRVLSPYGRGVSRARVSMTDSTGQTQTVMTNPFGFYTFGNITVGDTYILQVRDKRYTFTPQAISLTEEATDINFKAQQ
jgi:hypothetical protein